MFRLPSPRLRAGSPAFLLLFATALLATATTGRADLIIISPPPPPDFPVGGHRAEPLREVLAQEGAPTGFGDDRFQSLLAPLIDSQGQVTFSAEVGPFIGLGGSAIFRSSAGADDPIQLLHTGDAAPGGGSFIFFVGARLRSNEDGETLSIARIDLDGDGRSDADTLVRTGASGVSELLRTGDLAPDANGTISAFGQIALGPSGEAAVTRPARLSSASEKRKSSRGLGSSRSISQTSAPSELSGLLPLV